MKLGIGIGALILIVLIGGYYVTSRGLDDHDPNHEGHELEHLEEGAQLDTHNEDTTTSENTPIAATGVVREFVVEGGMMYFSPNEIEVDAGDTVRIVYKNKDGRHDWVIDEFDARTDILGPGQEQTVEFVADRAGTFEFYCSVGNHRAMGMVGTLTVR